MKNSLPGEFSGMAKCNDDQARQAPLFQLMRVWQLRFPWVPCHEIAKAGLRLKRLLAEEYFLGGSETDFRNSK